MRIASSSFALAALAFSPALAAPTPTMPYDSPVPNSPRIDDWSEAVRSPRIPRSPMLPAVRVAGRRRSIPRFKRQEDGATPADESGTASAQGLLGGLGDALSGVLHSVADIANGLPVVGGLGILSTDDSPDPVSPPPQKRQDADTASAQGLLGGLGDTLDGILHQVADVANGLPVVGGLGILSTDGSSAPQKRQDADTASAQGLLGGLGDTLNGILHQVADVANGLPVVGGLGILSTDGSDPATAPQKRDAPQMPSMTPDQLNALRQQVATLLLQQQQADQAASTLSAASAGLPVNPDDLRQRLLAMQNTAQVAVGGLNLQGLLGGLPVAGPLVANTLSNGPVSTTGGLPVVGGVLSSVGGVTSGLPILGGILGGGGNDILGGLLGGGQGALGTVTGAANGVVGGVAAAAGGMVNNVVGNGGVTQNVLGAMPASQAFASTEQLPWPDVSGFYPHTLTNGAPVVPPNSPASIPSSIIYGSFGMDGSGATPPVPPPSPASSAGSVPMDHDTASPFLMASPSIPVPSSAPSMAAAVISDTLNRRGEEPEVTITEIVTETVATPEPTAEPTTTADDALRRRADEPETTVTETITESMPEPTAEPSSTAADPLRRRGEEPEATITETVTEISAMPEPTAEPSPAAGDPLRRRRVDGDVVGETPSQVQPDDNADGFSPSMPDATYTPPLLMVSKRSDVGASVPGPWDTMRGTAPRQVKMFRRLLRGASVSF